MNVFFRALAGALRAAAGHGLDGLPQMPEAWNLAGRVEGYLVHQLQAFKSGERNNEQGAGVVEMRSLQDIEGRAAYFASLDTARAAHAR